MLYFDYPVEIDSNGISDATTALLYSLYVPYMPTSNAQPQTSNIISAIGQWLGALSQNGQWKMGIATIWRVAFGDVSRQ